MIAKHYVLMEVSDATGHLCDGCEYYALQHTDKDGRHPCRLWECWVDPAPVDGHQARPAYCFEREEFSHGIIDMIAEYSADHGKVPTEAEDVLQHADKKKETE